jgi:hypothetical protein
MVSLIRAREPAWRREMGDGREGSLPMKHTAQCHCGGLRVHVTAAPLRNLLCHCLACRRRTGSAVHWGAYFAPEAVRLEGESRAYTRPADSGATLTFQFCPTCGTNLLWHNDSTPERVGVPAGCFAESDFPRRPPPSGRSRRCPG